MTSSYAYKLAGDLRTGITNLGFAQGDLMNTIEKLYAKCYGKITDAIVAAINNRIAEIQSVILEMNNNAKIIDNYAYKLYLQELEAKRLAEEAAKSANQPRQGSHDTTRAITK